MARGFSLVHGEFGLHLSILSQTALPRYFWQRVLGKCRRVASNWGLRASGVFQDEGASVSEIEFRGFPACAGGLVPEFGCVGWGFVIIRRNPGPDGLPGRCDGLEGPDNEGRFRGWRKTDEGLPETEEAEEEFDFTWADDSFHAFHGALTMGTFEGIGTPDAEDEIPPERAHGAGGGFWRGGDERDFRLGVLWGFLRQRLDEGCSGTGEAAGFVGVEAVITNCLLAFGRDVLDGGGEKVGGFEDFEVPFGVPTAAGMVNDGFGVGVPSDFLEGEGGAQEILSQAFPRKSSVMGPRSAAGMQWRRPSLSKRPSAAGI